MTETEKNKEYYNKLYYKLIGCEEFDELELLLKKPNIFNILNISDYEIRHSNFLAWLLDPNESHGLKEIFLQRFLRNILDIEDLLTLKPVDFLNVEIKREWKHIDLLIIFEGQMVIAIENKIYASESNDQLDTYKKAIEKEFQNITHKFVFLTPSGSLASDNDYDSVSYSAIIEILIRMIELYGDSMTDAVNYYIKDYLTILTENIMEEGKRAELAQNLYKGHKEIIDFIDNYKPDIVYNVGQAITKTIGKLIDFEYRISHKHEIRFIPNALIDYVEQGGTPEGHFWATKDKFSFSFNLTKITNTQETGKKTEISLFFSLAPWHDKVKRAELREELNNKLKGEGSKGKGSIGKQWSRYNIGNIKINIEEFEYGSDDETLQEEIENILNNTKETINSITNIVTEFCRKNPN